MAIENKPSVAKKPWYRKKLLWLFLIILFSLGGIAFYIYNNFNKLLSEALIKNFNTSLASDVYELKFEKLRVNIFDGDIRVSNVVLQPREKPLQDYPYINSSFVLKTGKLVLKNVMLKELLQNNNLRLDKIEIDRPDVLLNLSGAIHILFPFKDSTIVSNQNEKKKTIDSFLLKTFELIDANFKVVNSFEEREFEIKDFDFAFNDLYLSQNIGIDSLICKSVKLSIGSASGTMLKSGIRTIQLNDYEFSIDNLHVQKSIDATNFHFSDLNTSIKNLDILLADSIYRITLGSFGLSYKEKTIKLEKINFIRNVSEAEMQKRFRFQHTQFSGSVGSMDFVNVNFDSLIYNGKLFVDELVIDSVTANIFKDKTKPVDLKRFPGYPGQQIAAIPLPLRINKVVVRNGTIFNKERKPDRSVAKVSVNKLNATVTNVTNIEKEQPLSINGEAYLENRVLFKVDLVFDYTKPQFTINAKIPKFDIKNLNALMKAYTPANTNSGVVDEISLSGKVYHTHATGTLKFLYHDLNIDLQLKEQAQWKSTLGALAANTVLNASNPLSAEKPARIVKFGIERDMNKGFINIIIKSLLEGIKETMLPSKANRKAFNKTKKEWKDQQKP